MAGQTAGNLEDRRDEFNEAQLHMLEEISGRAPADVLQAAQDIKLIDSETRDAIEAALPKNHVLLFQNALAKGSGPKAFKRAFEAVYGRALLEHRKSGLEDPYEPVMQRLAEVLKFPIDRKVGLKGRSELVAAVRRLDIVASEVEHAVATGVGIAGLPKDSIAAKIVKKIGEKISAKNKELAAEQAKITSTDTDEVAKKRAEKRIVELEKELKILDEQKGDSDLVGYVMAEAFPKETSGADMERLKRLHQDAERHQHEVQEVYKYFADSVNIKKIVEGSRQVDEMTKEWTTERGEKTGALDKEIKAINKKIKAVNKKINPETDPAEKARLEAEKANLEKARTKADLPLNARVNYLKEQISLKEKATLSADQMSKRLNEDLKIQRFNSDTDRDTARDTKQEKMNADNERIAEERGELKEEVDRLNLICTRAKEFKTELVKLVDNAAKAEHAGVEFTLSGEIENADKTKRPRKVSDLVKILQGINPENRNFDPKDLSDVYAAFQGLFDDQHQLDPQLEKFDKAMAETTKAVKDRKKELDHAERSEAKSKDLTDAQAAKRIVGALVGAQFPDISETDKAKLAGLVLAGDVAKLQTEEDYEQLANRASAEDFKAVEEIGLRGKLIGFQYKEGDKVVQPFKGLKPEDFKDWAAIEKLFNIEKLNHKNGFFLLAALELFDQVKDPDGKVRSMQALRVEEKLKALLAKQLGVHERMDEAGISKIIDEAFKEQMKKVRPLVKAHFDNYADKGGEFKEHKIELLNLKYDELTDKLRNKKINQEIYEVKLKALIKEAVEADVDGQVKFSQDSVAAGYWNSSEAQWIKDKAHDTGVFVGKKAAAVGLGAPALIGLKGAWGATKLGASLGFHTVLFPFRAAKYPLIALAKPGIWAINLFRKTPWQPLPTIRQALSNDIGRVVGYGTKKAGETLQGATKAVTETPANMWKMVGWKSTKYADRKKDESELRTEQMKVLEERAALTPVEVASSPFIDLAEYKEKIKALNEMVGAKTAFPAGHDVSAGHTEKAKEEKKEGHDKKDDHGHEAKAAGGHHS